mmetsp:Transcript_4720/g.6689  ORF Transcript_4720/g.6689 Transcript_4720/m.6689 type:complete len:84 (-) Transcript_4720:698-949(-)
MKHRPTVIDAATAGIPAAPKDTISAALNLAPTQTIPALRILVVQNFRPGSNSFGRPTKLLMLAPRRIATGIPEIGLGPVGSSP